GALQPLAQLGQLRLVLDHRQGRPPAQRLLGQLRHVAPRRQGRDLDLEPRLLEQVEGGNPHRSGGAQDGDLPRQVQWPHPRWFARRAAAITTTANISPSTRSNSPPWPGIRSPESFTPKRRFSADSQRSPAMVARPT